MGKEMKSLILLALLLLVPAGLADTVCYPAMSPECSISIHINIAFSYNDSEISQGKIDAWVKESEDTWNGPNGYQTYGECDCKVKFQVNAMKVTDPAQVNCTPGPPGYHCVMVTDYDKNKPKNAAGNETYRGYMYGVAREGESSINGWWSDEMGEPHPNSPTGENALDAAHEAGHMLGLDDDYDKGPPERHGKNIMGTTFGPDAKPTQEQINTVVEKNCPEGACPDECCRTPGKSCHVSLVMESCHSGNFLGPLSKQGRTIAVSCAANEVSFFGRDTSGNVHGGDYTNGYVKDVYDPRSADTNNDSTVSVAEAHTSAKAKLSLAKKFKKTQTPGFYSNECECLPLSCVGKCGDGNVDEANEEECDYNATPTGCPTGQTCNEDCECEEILTPEPPQECGEGESITQQVCESLCAAGQCLLNELTECWRCLAGGCEEDEYTSQSACEDDCDEPDYCSLDEGTECWMCLEGQTCADRGMYDSQGDCEDECAAPDRCEFNEGYDCWYCQQVNVICNPPLYDDADCDGDCDSDDGETCVKYNDYCYRCVCPDLYISYRKTSVSKSASTHCESHGEIQVCETTCTLTATVQITVKNGGTSMADSSSARVEINPGVGSKTAIIGQLLPGGTSSNTLALDKSGTAIGSGAEACEQLEWWVTGYTTVATADYNDDVAECDEDNNENSGQTS